MVKKKGVISQSLRNSIKDAGAVSVMDGVGTNFVSPYAIAMQATPFQVGLLTSIANLLAPWFQIFSNKLIRIRSRKFIVTKAVLFHALLWLPLALIPFFIESASFRAWSVVVLFALIAIVGGFASPAWSSWIGDLVKEEEKGRFFSKRNKIAGSVVLISSLFAAWFLKLFNGNERELNGETVLIGFSTLFFIAFLARLISRYYLNRQYEPRFVYDPESYFSIGSFIKRLRNSNLGKFVLYSALLRFAVAVSGPFFAVYMLRDLNFSYPAYISMTVASSLGNIAILSLWGRLSDRFGTVKIIIISGLMLSFIPLFWLISRNWYYLLLVNAFGGAAWGGFGLAGGNFIFDVVPRKKRSFAFAYHNIFVGAGIFLGATVGGLIATHSSFRVLGNVYLFLFLISGLARLFFTLIFVFGLREERRVEDKPIVEIASTELMKGFINDVFVFVDNVLPRTESIEEALKVNKIKLESKKKILRKRILKFNRKFSDKKEKMFFTKI